MSKRDRIQNKHEKEQAQVQIVLGAKPRTVPLMVPNLPVIDIGYAAQQKAIEEARNAPKKAMMKEVNKQVMERWEWLMKNEIVVMLWVIHKIYGAGYYKLLEFVKDYRPIAEELTRYYEHDYQDKECIPLFAQALRLETGVDMLHIDEQVNEIFHSGKKFTPYSKKFEKRWTNDQYDKEEK